MTLINDRVQLIYSWYCAAMRRAGIKIVAPKDTPFDKTYQYRAMSLFAKRMEEAAFSEHTIKAIVNSVVRYGKKHGLIASKGVNILNMKAVVEICLKDIKDRDNSVNEVIQNVKRSREYLIKLGYKKASDLVKPIRFGGMSRLAYFVETGDLSPIFLAVSRTATAALNQIERSKLPTDDELMRIRAKLVLNDITRIELEKILGSDLNTAGLPRSIA